MIKSNKRINENDNKGNDEEMWIQSDKILTTGVYDRKGKDTITQQKFFGIVGLALTRGLGLTALLAYYANLTSFNITYINIAAGLIISILGMFIAIKSKNPIISFIGYNMIVIPFGLELGPILDEYSPEVVQNTLGMTAGITAIMGFCGVTYPNIFKKIGTTLTIVLLCIIIIRIAQIFIPSLDLGFIDYMSAFIFSLYIGYDIYRANSIQKTYDNAIDICIELYLDIINLFLELIDIKGRKK